MRRTKRQKFPKYTCVNSGAPVCRTNVGNLNRRYIQELRDAWAQNKMSENSKHELSRIMGLMCAEQDVGNLKNCPSHNSGTPGRRTRRRKSKNMHVQELWDSCAQNNTSEISKNRLSGILGLLCFSRNMGLLFAARRTKRRQSQ